MIITFDSMRLIHGWGLGSKHFSSLDRRKFKICSGVDFVIFHGGLEIRSLTLQWIDNKDYRVGINQD